MIHRQVHGRRYLSWAGNSGSETILPHHGAASFGIGFARDRLGGSRLATYLSYEKQNAAWSLMLRLIKETFSHWLADRAPSMGAALAFYSAFSVAPLLIIVIAIAGMAFGEAAAQGAIVGQLRSLVGEQGAGAIQAMLAAAGRRESGVVATTVGIFTLLIGATSAFVELQDSLDRIWEAPQRAENGIVTFFKSRVLSFGLVLAIGFLLLVSLVLTTALAAFTGYYSHLLPVGETLLQTANFIASFLVVTVLFAMIYKWLPNVSIAWRDVWIGSAVTALLFNIGRTAIGVYLGHSAVASAYGAAGTFVVLLLWLYYSAQVFLLGAEFTWVYAKRVGSRAVAVGPNVAPKRAPHVTDRRLRQRRAKSFQGRPSLARSTALLAIVGTLSFVFARVASPWLWGRTRCRISTLRKLW
jgi:membrane protein